MDFLRHLLGLLHGQSGQNDGELLAAVAGQRLFRAQMRPDFGRDTPQNLIPLLVPVKVVVLFEEVDVHHNHRQRSVGFHAGGIRRLQQLMKRPVVVHAGQAVHSGAFLQIRGIFPLHPHKQPQALGHHAEGHHQGQILLEIDVHVLAVPGEQIQSQHQGRAAGRHQEPHLL